MTIFCSRGLTSEEKSASSGKHTSETIELEVMVSAQPLRVLRVSESTKKGVTALAGAADPIYVRRKN